MSHLGFLFTLLHLCPSIIDGFVRKFQTLVSEYSFSAVQELIPSSIDSNLNPFEAGSKNLEKLVATVLILGQVWSPLPLFGLDSAYISPAEAVLYSPDTKVPRSGELALRRAIPANPNMKTIQACHYY